MASTLTRFLAKIDFGGGGGCWLWTAARDDEGYGKFNYSYAPRLQAVASRYAYELFHGPVPPGMQVDHLCRVRHCVNPGHLEAVTPRENTMRSTSFAAVNAVKTRCRNGHEFTPDNTYLERGLANKRRCRACRRRSQIRNGYTKP
jgi:hypothetical protein